jgi:hypothetical protein
MGVLAEIRYTIKFQKLLKLFSAGSNYEDFQPIDVVFAHESESWVPTFCSHKGDPGGII